MHRPLSLAVLTVLAVPFALAAACAEDSTEPVRTSVIASFTMPRGVLDNAETLQLRVFDGKASCATGKGEVTFPEGEDAARELVNTTLGTENCPENTKFCGSITIRKSTAPRVFEAKALGGTRVLALGCTVATANADTLPISIKMVKFSPAVVCGDGKLQPGEQCEPSIPPVCDDKCQSNEMLVSVGAAANNTSTGKSGDKTDAFFLWPAEAGDSGRLFAFFSDRAVPANGGTVDVGLRVLSDTLAPVSGPATLTNGSIFLPTGGAYPPQASPLEQKLPQAAFVSGRYWVAYHGETATSPDIHLRVMNKNLEVDPSTKTPLTVNGGTDGEPGVQTAPAVSANGDRIYVAWQDDASGTIAGRTVSSTLALGTQNQLSTGSGSTRPQIAATEKGWVVIWKSSAGIKLRAVDSSGTPSGGEIVVTQASGADGARVASLPDGRFAVVWSRNGDIFLQRYDDRGVAVGGDADKAINDVVTQGEQAQPTIAGTPAAGGSYVIAWRDARSGHIRARLAGGDTGFLPNSIDGEMTEFQASREDGHDRANPVAAVGGSGPFIAIGWEDKAAKAPGPGIVVRRFPLPPSE